MITFFANNLVDQSNITASSENLLFPLGNIKDPRRTKVFRSNENETSVVFDLMESSLIDSFMITCNPISGFGLSTITIEANATNEWSSPAFSTPLTFSTKFGVGLKELDEPITFRFVRLVITSSLGYVELSNLFIGEKLKPSRGINFNWTFKNDDQSVIKENRYGQKFVDIIGRQRLFNGNIQNLDDDNINKMFDMMDTKGKTRPMFIKIGCEGTFGEPERFMAMVFMPSIPNATNRFYKNWGIPVSFEEAK